MLIGAEPERPYERPPLSKDYLRGEAEREKLYVHDEGFYAEHDIELRARPHGAGDWTRGRATLVLDDGERLRLRPAAARHRRRAAAARRSPAATWTACCYLRSVADCRRAARAARTSGGSVVVVGAGWIGAEVAASARQRGLRGDRASSRPSRAARARARPRGRRRSTATSTPTTACGCCSGPASSAFEGAARVERVRTSDGDAISTATSSSSGVGVAPAHRAGRAGRASPSTTASSSTSTCRPSAPGVFAAGDVANAQHPFYGERVRVEHWANALDQGRSPRAHMLGQDAAYDRAALLLLRPVRRRHGVLGLRPRPGIASCSAAIPRAASSSPSGCRRPRRGGHERQRLGRHRPDPALIRGRVAVDDERLADPDCAARATLAPQRASAASS